MTFPGISRPFLAYLGVLALALGFVAFDLHWRFDEIQKTTAFGRSIGLATDAHLAPGSRERSVILPTMATDTRWWIMHTEQMLKDHEWRVRHTPSDNAPFGREVHWSSPPMWFMAGVASALSALNVFPSADSVQWAAVFVGPIYLCLLLIGLSWMVVRAFGSWPAIVLCLSLVGAWPLFQFFRAGEGDHHGLASCASMASVLCLLAAGATSQSRTSGKSRSRNDADSWPDPTIAGRWFVTSGIIGAVGLWISSASQIPALVGTAASALLIALLARRAKTWTIQPELWRVWGLSGGLASLAFYLLEYFPSHLGLRLEVNNPVYALAWIGGGEILFRLCRLLAGSGPISRNRAEWLTLFLSLVVCALPVVLVLFYKEHVFRVSDRFLFNLHSYYISEFQNFWNFQHAFKTRLQLAEFIALPILALATTFGLLVTKNVSDYRLCQLLAALGPALVLQAMALSQVRWGGNAMALWIALLVVCTAIVIENLQRRSIKPIVASALVLFFALSVAIYPAKSFLSWQEREGKKDGIDREFLPNIFLRDIAHRVIRNYSAGTPVILSGPDSTTDLIYFGGVKGLGTLYWENLDGLRAASQIYAAKTASETLELLTKQGVTHMVFFSWDSFAQRYVRLARGLGRDTEAKDGYIATLLEGRQLQPLWLRPVYYPMEQLGVKDAWVRIYEVVPNQTPAQWHYYVGVYQLQAGQLGPAEENFRKARAANPADPQAASALSALLLSRSQEDEAISIITTTLDKNGREAAPVFEELAAGLTTSQPGQADKIRNLLRTFPQENAPHLDAEKRRVPDGDQ